MEIDYIAMLTDKNYDRSEPIKELLAPCSIQ